MIKAERKPTEDKSAFQNWAANPGNQPYVPSRVEKPMPFPVADEEPEIPHVYARRIRDPKDYIAELNYRINQIRFRADVDSAILALQTFKKCPVSEIKEIAIDLCKQVTAHHPEY